MSAIRDILASDPHEALGSSPPPPAPPSSAPIDKPPTSVSETAAPPTTSPPVATAPKAADDPSTSTMPSTSAADAGNDSGNATTLRRNPNGSVSSVYSGNKMRHLKKDDGVPLWRKDIQYDFLSLVFRDETKCFTKYSDGTAGHTFADIYIDAMAKSSKCSKILKEKLLQDREASIPMAMVCLLVNVGRMNTTLNFFPEMRAQLRTYHSIPALQAHQDPSAYKQLQDAPRLKSILKGACEDIPQPGTLEEIKAARKPRTNPVNLVFLVSHFSTKINDEHFQPSGDFFDLVMRSSLSSSSRARAFLWLMWWYLESDFTAEDSQRNPFGPGQYADGEKEGSGSPFRIPTLESLTEEQAAKENIDTEEEQLFGEVKRKERIAILASEPTPAMTALKRARKEREEKAAAGTGMYSDDEASEVGWAARAQIAARPSTFNGETASDYTRSPSPGMGRRLLGGTPKATGDIRINHLLNSDDPASSSPPRPGQGSAAKRGPGRGNWRRSRGKQDKGALEDRSHPVPLLPNTSHLSFVSESGLRSGTPGSIQQHPSQHSPQGSTIHAFHAGSVSLDHIPTPSYQSTKRHRGVTQHQSALLNHRRLQIEYALDKRIRTIHTRARRTRQAEGALLRAWKRIRAMPADYDSDTEQANASRGKGKDQAGDKDEEAQGGQSTSRSVAKSAGGKENTGIPPSSPVATAASPDDSSPVAIDLSSRAVALAGFIRPAAEPTDVGEDARSLACSFRRASRRLERWDESDRPGDAIIARREGRVVVRPKAPGWTSGRKRRRSLNASDDEMDDGGDVLVSSSAPAGAAAAQPSASSRRTTLPKEGGSVKARGGRSKRRGGARTKAKERGGGQSVGEKKERKRKSTGKGESSGGRASTAAAATAAATASTGAIEADEMDREMEDATDAVRMQMEDDGDDDLAMGDD